MKVFTWSAVVCLAGFLASGCHANSPRDATSSQQSGHSENIRLSRFGEYEGYSEARYDTWVTTSRYVRTRDGTRIAVDISRPASDGVVTETPYPVLWTHSRYHRRWDTEPSIDSDPVLQQLLKHGYVIVAAAVRGSGASFGRYEGLWSEAETNDAYDLIDWLSKQPWCDGNVGMYGASYLGITQYMAASTHHPALKAIVPDVALFDFYDAIYTGGIYREDMVRHWSKGVRELDIVKKAVPVDDDPDGKLLDQAIRQHLDNFDPISELRAAPYRDSSTKSFNWYRDTPSMVIDKLNDSDVAAYHWSGWYDAFVMDALLLYRNFKGPEKLAIGPWPHEPITEAGKAEKSRLLGAESLRWFDYWLKRIDNGVMDDAPINYAVIDEPLETWSWASTNDLRDEATRVDYYFGAPRFHDDRAPDDNGLDTARPEPKIAFDYPVDPETTTGAASRWDTTVGGPLMDYPEMSPNDRRSLTFTTPPLERDVVVIGVPIVTLYASSSATDSDFYALLEEVDADGSSHYVSEGMLRASLRTPGQATWDQLGFPWQRARKEDRSPLVPGAVVELTFDIYPTAYLFNQGNRIRISIMGADKDNTEAPPAPDAVITVMSGGEQLSRVSFPVWRRTVAEDH